MEIYTSRDLCPLRLFIWSTNKSLILGLRASSMFCYPNSRIRYTVLCFHRDSPFLPDGLAVALSRCRPDSSFNPRVRSSRRRLPLQYSNLPCSFPVFISCQIAIQLSLLMWCLAWIIWTINRLYSIIYLLFKTYTVGGGQWRK